jgi:hypothetical protein
MRRKDYVNKHERPQKHVYVTACEYVFASNVSAEKSRNFPIFY